MFFMTWQYLFALYVHYLQYSNIETFTFPKSEK